MIEAYSVWKIFFLSSWVGFFAFGCQMSLGYQLLKEKTPSPFKNPYYEPNKKFFPKLSA